MLCHWRGESLLLHINIGPITVRGKSVGYWARMNMRERFHGLMKSSSYNNYWSSNFREVGLQMHRFWYIEETQERSFLHLYVYLLAQPERINNNALSRSKPSRELCI